MSLRFMTRAVLAALLIPAALTAQAPTANDDLAAKIRAELAAARKLPPSLDKVVTPVIDQVWDKFDRAEAMKQVEFMGQYWRLPGNPGFDASLDRVRTRLAASGFADVATRPSSPISKPSLWVEAAPTPSKGWDHSIGTLSIVHDGQADEVVLSKAKERLALCINSFSTVPGGVVAPLVDIGAGAAADFNGKDVKGAVVFGTGNVGGLFTEAVVKRGALGVVSPTRADYLDKSPDLLNWQSIPYDEEHKAFGFKSTTRAFDALKKAAAAGNARVRVEIASTFANKPERTLVAEIPGTTMPNERIVISAHLQEPGANDNASGTATNMELAHALAAGIASGRIPKPLRTLTFLWVNENAGTRRWLAENPAAKPGVKWGFSMDMTGEDITKTGGHFLIERWPDPGAVWQRPWDPHTEWGASRIDPNTLKGDLISDLHMAMCERVALKTGTWDVRTNPYEGGSDHTEFGRAGIPALLDWHFTDRFYHTNLDTSEKTSPDEMRNVGTAVASTAWLMASADATTSAAVKDLITKVGAARVAVEEREGKKLPADPKISNETIVAAWRKWYDEAIASVSRLVVTRPATPAPLYKGVRNHAPGSIPLSIASVAPASVTGQAPCDQVTMGPIPTTVVNVLWAADDRFFCTCQSHTSSHKEMRERELLFDTGPRSQSVDVRRAVALALGRLESPALTIKPLLALLNDPQPSVRAEAANALAQTAKPTDVVAVVSAMGRRLYNNPPPSMPTWPGFIVTPANDFVFFNPPATYRMENETVVTSVLEAIARMPYAPAEAPLAAQLLYACMLDLHCPQPLSGAAIDFRVGPGRLMSIARGFESFTRKFPKITLDSDAVKNLRRLAVLGQQDFTRAAGAFDNRRDVSESQSEQLAMIRRLTMQTLINAGDRDKDTVLKAVSDGDWQVRRLGTTMLAGLPLDGADADTFVINALEQKLKDSAFQVRIEAVKVAARVAVRSGDCSVLLNMTSDEAPLVVLQAIDGLAPACKNTEPILERLHVLADSLSDTLTTTPWQFGARALTALGRLAPADAATYLAKREILTSPIWQLRATVATVAGRLKNEPVLLTYSKDPVANVRVAALDGLRAMGSTHLYAEAIDALLSDDFQLIRTAAISLKGAPKSDDTSMALVQTLKRLTDDGKDTSRDPRMALFERITEQAPLELLPVIKAHLTDFDPEIAKAAKTLCERLVPDTEFKAEPHLRTPVQATLEEVQDLPKEATLVMKGGGQIVLQLSADTPMTVARFAKLARAGYYDGLTFHRIVPNFVIQGGSPGASEYVGDARFMRDELGRMPHLRGAAGISTRGRDTGDAQIFFDLVDLPRLDHDYTVFATILNGLSEMDRVVEGAVIQNVVIK